MKGYIRLLTYDNACKVIDFINANDGLDYAYITIGGISVDVADKNWVEVEKYIQTLTERYEVSVIPPYKVVEGIVKNLKDKGVI